VKAFRSLPKFRAGEPFAPWLLSIVANETKNLLRSRHRRNALALRLSALEPDAATPDTPFDEAAASERRARLLAAVNALPDRERQRWCAATSWICPRPRRHRCCNGRSAR
jgi:DNA-directed RNA polymerase specialized sigma subunit, sigma24 homolog